MEFSNHPINLKDVKRPKGYNTFTSMKGTTGIYIQKPRYEGEKHGSRRLVSDLVTASVQRGVEFDCYSLFLGSADGKRPPNPTFAKLALTGFKCDGKTVYIGPAYLQELMEAQVSASTNRVMLWKDRPRSDAEKALEKALEEKTLKIMASEEEIGRLRDLLTRNKIVIPSKEG